MRGDGRVEALDRHVVARTARRPRQQLVIGRPHRVRRLGQPGDHRLERARRLRRCARSAATIAAATTVLPTPVSVPVTNSPRINRRRAAGAGVPHRGGERRRGGPQLAGLVGGHHRQAQARGAARHRRRADRLGEHAAGSSARSQAASAASASPITIGTIWVARVAVSQAVLGQRRAQQLAGRPQPRRRAPAAPRARRGPRARRRRSAAAGRWRR